MTEQRLILLFLVFGNGRAGASSPPVLLRFGMILAAYYRTHGQIGNTAGSDSRMNPGLGRG